MALFGLHALTSHVHNKIHKQTLSDVLKYSLLGGRQCSGPGYPKYLQCPDGVYHLLVDLRYHGCSTLRREIFQGECGGKARSDSV